MNKLRTISLREVRKIRKDAIIKLKRKGKAMNNELKVFNGNEVEVLELNGEVLFNLQHVGMCLEITDINSSVKNFNANQLKKLTNSITDSIRFRKIHNTGENFLTEAGVYKLIFRSRKPEAERFQDWVAEEVLPSIRKTGQYSQKQFVIDNPLVNEDGYTVSAMRLHRTLKTSRKFVDWFRTKVTYNPFFKVDKDFTAVFTNDGKRDYYLTIDTARKIAMSERTPIGEDVANGFNGRAKTPDKDIDQMKLLHHFEFCLKLAKLIKDYEPRVVELANEMVLNQFGIDMMKKSGLYQERGFYSAAEVYPSPNLDMPDFPTNSSNIL